MQTDYSLPESAALYSDTFLVNYEFEQKSAYDKAVILTYFAFTSLSTVGFGDFAPISNTERLIGAFILLLGVAVFSYIMGNFIEILTESQNFNKDLEEDDLMNKFFGTLKRFNNDEPIDHELKERIEAHFNYRWTRDKNVAYEGDISQSIMEQLQTNKDLLNSLYRDFIYHDFIRSFSRTFKFPNQDSEYKHAMYTWADDDYREFMLEVLTALEPRREENHRVLMYENEEVNEILFFNKGQYVVGFELNNVLYFMLKFKEQNLIGGYNITFNKRSLFVYKTTSVCEGFSIRRKNWKSIMANHPKITPIIQERIRDLYENYMYNKLKSMKEKRIALIENRADYEQIH